MADVPPAISPASAETPSGGSIGKRRVVVQKYGGSSLAEPEQICSVAKRVAALRDQGFAAIVVVSAMGKTTDQLLDLAYRVSPTPNRRELDMLLTTGERVSMALVGMALNDEGCAAISFTGSQAGVLTDEAHSNARVIDVRAPRVESELAAGRCAVIAGFQGVSPRTKEITTLGRGGSDVTAVALAARFSAERCEILKDVDGVYSADPRDVPDAKRLPVISSRALLDMTFWGAKVLHYRSVELAHSLGVPLSVSLAHPKKNQPSLGTMVTPEVVTPESSRQEPKMFEETRVLSVNSLSDVRWLSVDSAATPADALAGLESELVATGLPWPQLLDGERVIEDGKTRWAFLVSSTTEALDALARAIAPSKKLRMEPGPWSAVTATCQGAYASDLSRRIAMALATAGVDVRKMIFGAMSVTVVVKPSDRVSAERALHSPP